MNGYTVDIPLINLILGISAKPGRQSTRAGTNNQSKANTDTGETITTNDDDINGNKQRVIYLGTYDKFRHYAYLHSRVFFLLREILGFLSFERNPRFSQEILGFSQSREILGFL